MKSKAFHFSKIQVVVLCFFFMMSFFFFQDARPYREERTEDLNPVVFWFLPKGDYTLTVEYGDSPVGNSIQVYSKDAVDENNSMGIVYTKQPITQGSGVVCVPLSLEQHAYNISVNTVCDVEEMGYLKKVYIQSNRLVHTDNYALSAIMLFAGGILALLFVRMRKKSPDSSSVQADSEMLLGYPEKYVIPLVLVGMGIGASIPLFSDFILWESDVEFHLARLEGIYRGMASGDFPVRITPQQMSEYGGLTATMYPQLLLYPFALLRFFRVSLMLCYKILVVALNIATAFTAYYSAKNVCKSRNIALGTSILYTFSVYRLCNVYVRGALGESLAMVFLPLLIWGSYEVLWGERRWFILVLGMTGVLESHVLSTEMCALFMILELVCWLFSRKKEQLWKRFFAGCKAVIVTVLLNAGFLVPFLYFCGKDLQCFILPYEVPDSVAYFSQMFTFFPPVMGVSMSPGSTQGEMPITVGGILLLGVLLFLFTSRKTDERREREGVGLHCLVLGGVAVFLSSWLFPWGKMGELEFFAKIFGSLQFSWRFLGPATMFWCLTSAIGIEGLVEAGDRKERTDMGHKGDYKWIYGVVAVLVVISVSFLFDALSQQRMQNSDKINLEGTHFADGMYTYCDSEKFRAIQLDYWEREPRIMTTGEVQMKYADYRKNGSHIYVEVTPLEEGEEYLIFPLYWFHGYEITVNGEKVPTFALDTLVACKAPTETAVIQVHYAGFWFFWLADGVTLVTCCTILGYGLYKRKRRL